MIWLSDEINYKIKKMAIDVAFKLSMIDDRKSSSSTPDSLSLSRVQTQIYSVIVNGWLFHCIIGLTHLHTHLTKFKLLLIRWWDVGRWCTTSTTTKDPVLTFILGPGHGISPANLQCSLHNKVGKHKVKI